MADISLTGQKPGFSNLPDDGIDIASVLAAAQPPGGPVLFRIFTGLSGTAQDATEVLISTDGTVAVEDPRYGPVIADGKLVALRDLEPAGG